MVILSLSIIIIGGLFWWGREQTIERRPAPSGKPRETATYYRMKGINQQRKLTKKLKNKIRQRFGHQCVYCLSKNRVEVDHIIPRYDGGPDEEWNLHLLCENCNDQKSDFWTYQAKELCYQRNETAIINGQPLNFEQEEREFIEAYNQTKRLREPMPWYRINTFGEPIPLREFSFKGMIGIKALEAFHALLDTNYDHVLNSWIEKQNQNNPLFKKGVSPQK